MKSKICPVCGSNMVRNGKTESGKQRFRCKACGSSKTHSYNSDSKELKEFLDWLLSKQRQVDMKGGGRTFRRNMAKFWSVWSMPNIVDEVHRVIFIDAPTYLFEVKKRRILTSISVDYTFKAIPKEDVETTVQELYEFYLDFQKTINNIENHLSELKIKLYV